MLTPEQIQKALEDTTPEEVVNDESKFLSTEQVQQLVSKEPESEPSFLKDVGRVLMDTGENIAFAPLNLANTISEGTVPEWFFKAARKEAVNVVANPLDSLGFKDTAESLRSAMLTEEGDIKEVETGAGIVASMVPYIAGGAGIYKSLKKGPEFVKGAISGAAIDQILFDRVDGTMVDGLEEVLPEGVVKDAVSFLSSDEDDTELDMRLKEGLIGITIGSLFDLAGGTAQGAGFIYRKFKKTPEELTDEERAEVAFEMLSEAKQTADLKLPEEEIKLSETPEDSSQVALQNSNKVRKFVNRFFTTRGYWTPKAYNAMQDSEYAQRQTIAKAEHIALRLQKSIDEMVESADKEEVVETINSLFTQDLRWLKGKRQQDKIIELADMYNLTDTQAEEFLNARELIDQLSKDLVGSSSVADSLKETIVENTGEYIRRSYRLYEDSGYKPEPKIKQDAEDFLYLQNLNMNPNMSESVAREQAKDQVEEILNVGNASEFVDYFSSLRKVNKDILKSKESIPPEIRALMGEIKEPSENIILTVSKMSNLLETNKFYSNLEKLGQSGGYIFKEGQKRDRAVYSAKITGTNSNLDGQYTTPEILDEIKNNTSKFITGDQFEWYKNFLSAKGATQKLKTVFSHVTHIRNVTGGAQFGIANGVNPFGGEAKETFKLLKDSILKQGDKSFNNTYEKYLRLGIINTNVRANEFRALLEAGYESSADTLGKNISKKLESYGLSKNKQKFIENLYVATDDFYKINYFNQELKTLESAFPDIPINILEERAASIVRNTMPNYDRVPKGVKALKGLPIGSFFSFPAEIIRTTAHIATQGAKEVRSKNDVLAKRGAKRLAGLTATTASWGGIASGTSYMAGFSEDEHEAIQTLSATPWSQVAPKNVVKIGDKIYTNDTQYIDSYSPIKEPFRAAAASWAKGEITEEEYGKRLLDTSMAFTYQFFKPYVEETILTAALTDVGLAAVNENGRTPDGKEVFTPGLSAVEKASNVLEIVGKSFTPGSVTSIQNLVKAYTGEPSPSTGKTKPLYAELLANATGVKFTELDIENTFKYAINDYKSARNEVINIGVNYGRDAEEIKSRYKQGQEKIVSYQTELYSLIQASQTLVGEKETDKILLDGGLSKKDISFLSRGKAKPNKPSIQLLQTIHEKTPDVKGGEAVQLQKDLLKIYYDLLKTDLIKPVEKEEEVDERLQKAMGGVVDQRVPNAPLEPDERINKLTGVPYNEEAGAAYMDETDPMRVLRMASGGRVRYSKGAVVKAIAEYFAPKKQSGFYSEVEKQTANLNISKPVPGQSIINNLKKRPEVTDEELEWTGVVEQFKDKQNVTKEEVLDFVQQQDFDFDIYTGRHKKQKEEVYEDDTPADPFLGEEDEETVFWNWVDETYPEEAEMISEIIDDEVAFNSWYSGMQSKFKSSGKGSDFKTVGLHLDYAFEGGDTQNYREVVFTLPSKFKKVEKDYEHTHFPALKNPVAHIRLADIEQTDDAFNKTLLIDEIQSDAQQEAKKVGYLTEQQAQQRAEKAKELESRRQEIVNSTLSEEEKNKRLEALLDEASEQGMTSDDGVPDLPFKSEKRWALQGLRKSMMTAAEEGYDQVALTTGRMQAERNAKDVDAGEGKKFLDFYDKTLMKLLKTKFADKYGVDIKMIEYKQGDNVVSLPTIEMTEAMREDILKGLPMFRKGGKVTTRVGKVYNTLKRNCS